MADNIKASPQTLEQVGLTLTSRIQDGKLIIQGLITKDVSQYIGQMNNNMDEQELEDIEILIERKKVKVFPISDISDNLIKILVNGKTIQLKSKPKPKQQKQNSNDTETIHKLLETQSLMEIQIKKQNDELLQHKKLIDELQMNLKSLNLTVKLQMSSYSSFKKSVENFMSQTKRRLNTSESKFEEEQSELYQLVKNEKQSQKVDKLDDDKIEEMKNLIDQMRKQIIELKHNFKDKTTNSLKIGQVSQAKQTDMQEKIKQLKSQFQKNLNSLKQHILFLLRFQISKQNEPIRSSKWSEQLKSKQITINNNVVTLTNETDQFEFCFLNASFSNTIKTKQSWAIKYNKKTDWIQLGVCLKSKMLEYNFNFNGQNINWSQTGHGFYMIGSSGYCYSHSQKEFNCVFKIFQFGVNDVIYVEYDPINLKLRFSKNKVEYFEMPIIAPPQNDAYHPFVLLCGQNDSAELIQP